MNFLEAKLVSRRPDGVEVALADGTRIVIPRDAGNTKEGETLTLGVRPEHLGVGAGDGSQPSMTVSVNLTEQLGGESFIYGALQSGESIIIKQAGQIFIKAGSTISAQIDPGLCHLFDRDGQALAATARQRRPALAVGGEA